MCFIPKGNHVQLWPLPHTSSLLLTVFLSLFPFFSSRFSTFRSEDRLLPCQVSAVGNRKNPNKTQTIYAQELIEHKYRCFKANYRWISCLDIFIFYSHLLIYSLSPGVGDLLSSYNGVRKWEWTFKQEFTEETQNKHFHNKACLCECVCV